MSQDGYTLTEMLVALVLAGLAMVGASGAVRVLSESQIRVVKAQSQAHIMLLLDREINAMLGNSGPFDTSNPRSLVGNSSEVSIPCDGQTCSVIIWQTKLATKVHIRRANNTRQVSIPRSNAIRLSYLSALDGRQAGEWPPRDRTDRLGAIAIMEGEKPLAVGDVVVDQPAACAFDARTGGCSVLGIHP